MLEEKPEGIVIACCADGDLILLCSDGSLLRFSHEAPEIVGQWPGLEQFLYEAVTEE